MWDAPPSRQRDNRRQKMGGRPAVFIEFPEQVAVFEAALGHLRDAQVVALSPHAALELEWAGMPHTILADHFIERTIEEFGEETTSNVNALVELIDGHLQGAVEEFRSAAFRPTWISAYNLKKLYDSVALRLFELSRYMEAAEPASLIYAAPVALEFDETLNWRELSVYSHTLRALAQAGKIEGLEIPFDFGIVQSTSAALHFAAEVESAERAIASDVTLGRRVVRGLTARSRRAVGLLGRLRTRLTTNGTREHAAPGSPTILDLQRTLPDHVWSGRATVWSWQDATGPILSSSGIQAASTPVAPLGAQPLRAALLRAWETILTSPKYRACFRYEDAEWHGVVASRMQLLCTDLPLHLWQKRIQARQVLADTRADAVLLRNPNSLGKKTVADVARSEEIPVVGTQHGEYGFRDHHTLQYQDFAFCTHLLVTADGVREFCDRYYPGVLETVTVGWPDLEASRDQQLSRQELCDILRFDPARPLVVLCFTALEGNTRALRNTLPSDCSTFRKLRRIVDVCVAHPEVQFLIKGYPGLRVPVTPFYMYLDRVHASHLRINSTLPFSRILGAADAYVLNCPATTLTQLAAYDRPIYVFEDWFRWDQTALEAVRSRCVLEDDVDRFCSRLDDDLRSGVALRAERLDHALRDRYADSYRDGRSVVRARDAVLRIVSAQFTGSRLQAASPTPQAATFGTRT